MEESAKNSYNQQQKCTKNMIFGSEIVYSKNKKNRKCILFAKIFKIITNEMSSIGIYENFQRWGLLNGKGDACPYFWSIVFKKRCLLSWCNPYNFKIIMGCGVSSIVLVGRLPEIVIENWRQRFMFKFVHGFGFFNLNKNI